MKNFQKNNSKIKAFQTDINLFKKKKEINFKSEKKLKKELSLKN